jgi:hypothetical protein
MLTRQGLFARETRGNTVYYTIADESVYDLCDLVCSNIARHVTKSLSEKRLSQNTRTRDEYLPDAFSDFLTSACFQRRNCADKELMKLDA